MDATCIQGYLSHKNAMYATTCAYETAEPGSRDFLVADVDGDNRISIFDALRIQRYLAGRCNLDGSPVNN